MTNDEKQEASIESELVLFNEWRELFVLYRNKGKLDPVQRARFQELSIQLASSGLLSRSVNSNKSSRT